MPLLVRIRKRDAQVCNRPLTQPFYLVTSYSLSEHMESRLGKRRSSSLHDTIVGVSSRHEEECDRGKHEHCRIRRKNSSRGSRTNKALRAGPIHSSWIVSFKRQISAIGGSGLVYLNARCGNRTRLQHNRLIIQL